MSRNRSKPRVGEEHEIVVEGLAYGGSGIGRLRGEDGKVGMAVFVPRSAPGDSLRVRIERVERRHAEASVVEVTQPGPGRVEPTCPHYAEGCGGCSWQHLDYSAQVSAKETMVRDSLERIGGFSDLPIHPIIVADEPWFYRNKMEFSFNAADGLGLYRSGNWRSVVPITECRLESELAMRVLEVARSFAAEHDLSYWNPVTQEGLLREIVIRHGRGSGQAMVALVTAPGSLAAGPVFAEQISSLDPSITSILHAVRSTSGGDPIASTTTLWGDDTIVEEVAGLRFSIGLQTFFQTSTTQAARMLEIVKRQSEMGLAAMDGGDSPGPVLDLFCGVGFFSLALAGLADQVVGVEIVEPSIVAARDNARINGIENVAFYAGDARRTLPDIIERHGAPALVVLDPPRSGAGAKVMRRIARAAPTRVVYVSCNPTTLARDLKEIEPFGYRITDVQPIDLFPQTYHVEAIVTADLLAEPDESALARR